MFNIGLLRMILIKNTLTSQKRLWNKVKSFIFSSLHWLCSLMNKGLCISILPWALYVGVSMQGVDFSWCCYCIARSRFLGQKLLWWLAAVTHCHSLLWELPLAHGSHLSWEVTWICPQSPQSWLTDMGQNTVGQPLGLKGGQLLVPFIFLG